MTYSTLLNLIIIFIPRSFPVLKGEICSETKCSNVEDYVCGIADKNGVKVIQRYQNICHLNRIKCELKPKINIYQVPGTLCNITKAVKSRRANDFGIVGAQQGCGHACPTHCIETYEPVCAKIWKNSKSFKYRTVINHCHIDMLSCAAGFNITIEPLARCYTNPSGLYFTMQVAGLNSLRLIDNDASQQRRPLKSRRNIDQWTAKNKLSQMYGNLDKFERKTIPFHETEENISDENNNLIYKYIKYVRI